MSTVKEYSVQEKLTGLVTLQKIDSKLDELKVLKGELPMEVADLEDEILGLHSRQTRIEEEINGITEERTDQRIWCNGKKIREAKWQRKE
jgi:predicted  nucleic acid-binding Zn-ribbon protein